MSLKRLQEILTASSSTPVNTVLYEISEPARAQGDLVDVLLRPRALTGLYGTRRVTLARLDLAESPIEFVPYKGDTRVHDLVRRAVLGNYYNYFILAGTTQAPLASVRVLKPLFDDIIDDAIVVTSNNTVVTIRAKPESYFFFGQKEITLQL